MKEGGNEYIQIDNFRKNSSYFKALDKRTAPSDQNKEGEIVKSSFSSALRLSSMVLVT